MGDIRWDRKGRGKLGDYIVEEIGFWNGSGSFITPLGEGHRIVTVVVTAAVPRDLATRACVAATKVLRGEADAAVAAERERCAKVEAELRKALAEARAQAEQAELKAKRTVDHAIKERRKRNDLESKLRDTEKLRQDFGHMINERDYHWKRAKEAETALAKAKDEITQMRNVDKIHDDLRAATKRGEEAEKARAHAVATLASTIADRDACVARHYPVLKEELKQSAAKLNALRAVAREQEAAIVGLTAERDAALQRKLARDESGAPAPREG